MLSIMNQLAWSIEIPQNEKYIKSSYLSKKRLCEKLFNINPVVAFKINNTKNLYKT